MRLVKIKLIISIQVISEEFWLGMAMTNRSNGLEAPRSHGGFRVSYTFYKLYRNPKVMYSKFMPTAVSGPVLNPL
jgi:hypothetical protein